MDNHFHLLVRVPHRPEGFDVPLEVVVARLERALGEESAKLMHRNLEFWRTTKNEAAIEDWRQQQVARMFSLSEFMKAIQLRFSRWYNRRAGRKGTLWEGRYTSMIVEEEERALRTMAAYIDLNPVRAGMVADPADYRWCGYSGAMAGKARSRRGLVRIIGQMAWPRDSAAGAKPWGTDAFPALVERRALVFSRAILGGQGAERKRDDGSVVRRGLSEKVREKLTTLNERRLATEVLTRRVRHFTHGVIFGSRAIYARMRGWAKQGVLARVFEAMQAWQIIAFKIEVCSLDSTSVEVHPDGTGALKKTARNPSGDPGEDSLPRFIWLPQMSGRPMVSAFPQDRLEMPRKAANSLKSVGKRYRKA